MAQCEPNLSAWGPWILRRRKQLRAIGHSPSQASFFAVREAKCRARIAKQLGNFRALRLKLRAYQTSADNEVLYLPIGRLKADTIAALQQVPEVLWLAENRPRLELPNLKNAERSAIKS